MKTTATLVILICFNALTMFGQQTGDESADWQKRTESVKEQAAFETLLKKRAQKYNAQKTINLRSTVGSPSLVGTCNIITCGGFGLGETKPNYSWGGFKTAVDGSTYAANVAYDCWNDNGTVDYSEGQYISYSNSDANKDTPGIISPSPDGGGFAIFSYKNEAIDQTLTVLPNSNYTVCFEIAVIPRYSNSNGEFDEFQPNLSFGIGSGGIVISDALTYTHNDLTIHPVSDFPPKLSNATSGNAGFQNPGGWTEIDPFWETVCITFKSDNSGNVNIFYKTANPGRSVVVVDGLRLSMEGYANPPKFTSTVGSTKSVVFCEPTTVDLNTYISPSSIKPPSSFLTWSTNVDPLVLGDHLTNTNVTAPGTYYAFYYNAVDNCASPAAQLDLELTNLNGKIVSETDVVCEDDTTGKITVAGIEGVPPYTYSIDGGSTFQNDDTFSNLGYGNYTITIKDAIDCTVKVNASILSTDKDDPIIKAPANYTTEGCHEEDIKDLSYSAKLVEITLGELQSALNGGGNASDDIAIDTITYIDEIVSSDTCATEIKRTFTVTDTCGKTASDVQNIIIEDTTAPVFNETLPPTDITVECDNVPTPEKMTATDNCTDGAVVFKEDRIDGVCDSEYTLIRSWTAIDECGNQITHTQTITVEDNTAPTFVEALPADATVECDNVPTADVLTATDNCDANVTVSFTETLDGDADACPSEYTITRVWSVSDCAGNTTSHTQTITVEDSTAPTFVESLPADATVECDNVPTAYVLTATDNCDANVTVSFIETLDGDADACPSEYTITRVWSVSDCAGNTTSHTQTITVEDNTAPTFVESLPADATVECDNVPTADVLTATDNCDANVTVSFTETLDGDADACPSEYTITRVWSVSDCAGNTTSHTQTITVEDSTAPTFVESLPADATVECDNVPTAETLTAIDNCDSNFIKVEFNEVRTDGSCVGDYILTRTWTATDICENIAEHIQIITVTDSTAPIVTTSFEAELTVNCGDIPSAPQLEFEDNCASQIDVTFNETSTDDGSGSNFVITREWTVSDECENTAIFTQIVNVILEGLVTGGSTDLCIGDNFDYDLFELLSGDYGTNGTWEVTLGNATLNDNFFNPFELELGEYRFTYTDSESECPSVTEVIIILNDACVVLPCLDAFDPDQHIPKAVTANGDNMNDTFRIDVLDTDSECFDVTMQLQIFNRWGALIYESKDYQNNWGGESHNNSIGSSGKVPTGTYYYILKLIENGKLIASYAGPIYVGTK